MALHPDFITGDSNGAVWIIGTKGSKKDHIDCWFIATDDNLKYLVKISPS